MTPRRRLSVSVTYPAWLLALVLGVAFLLGTLAVGGTKRTSSDLLDRITDQATERMRQAVLGTLAGPRRLSEMNAALISTGQFEVGTFAQMQQLVPTLMIQLRSFSGVSAILVCNERRDTMWVERVENGRTKLAMFRNRPGEDCREWILDAQGRFDPDAPIGSFAYRPEDRPWYLAASGGTDGRGWSPLYVWAGSGVLPVVGCGRSVLVLDTDEDARSAVVDVGFTVQALSEQLSEIEISPNGEVFIMDSSGHLVATGSPEVPTTEGEKILLAGNAPDPLVAGAAKVLADPERTYVDPRGFRHGSFATPDGESYQVSSEDVDVAWGPDWTLVTIIPESDLLAGVRVVQDRLVYSGLAVLVFAGIAGLLLARSIVNPIIALRHTASRIIDGDLEATFDARGGREFLELSDDLEELTRALRERLAMRSALAVAMEVQQHLLPGETPELEHVEVAATSIYSDETGGDYFDFPTQLESISSESDGTTLVAIGDVTGHGIGAALIMATARSALRTRLHSMGDIGTVLTDVNRVLVEDVPSGRFMTLLMLRISPDGSSFRWGSAGHDPPILYDPQSDRFHEPDGGGVPLGIVADHEFEEYAGELGGPGSLLVAATDGVWETASPEKELYGKDRLRDLLRRHASDSPQAIVDAIIHELDEFRGSPRPLDDVTLIVLKRR